MGLIIRVVIWKEGLFVIVNSQGQQVLAWQGEHPNPVFFYPLSPSHGDLSLKYLQTSPIHPSIFLQQIVQEHPIRDTLL